jgi:hypothetical protein
VSTTDNLFAPSPEPAFRARTDVQATVDRIIALMKPDGSGFTERQVPGYSFTDRVPDPLLAIQAAQLVRDYASSYIDRAALLARREGTSWADLFTLLALEAVDGKSTAEVAYEHVLGPDPEHQPLWQTRTVSWHCSTCSAYVTDRGPYESHPDDNESGHTADCTRHQTAIAEWRVRTGWED